MIPAFNEELTIGAVVQAATAADCVGTVRVVSDGSSDNTAVVAREAGAEVMDLPYNRGKAGALAAGLHNLEGEIIVLLDGDLVGLTSQHITDLCKPLLEHRADMAIGLFAKGRRLIDWGQRLSPNLSGQRAISRALIDHVKRLAEAGFGIEVALTQMCRAQQASIVYVPLLGVTHITKEEKMGFARGLGARAKMYWQITAALLSHQWKE